MVGGSMSTNCKRRVLFAIGHRFADVNLLETGQADDVAGTGVLQFHLSHPGKGEKAGDVGALAAAVPVDADDRVADSHATADDSPERDAAEVIAVVEIRDQHLENTAPCETAGGGTCLTIASKSGAMSSLFSCSSRMAKPSFALA